MLRIFSLLLLFLVIGCCNAQCSSFVLGNYICSFDDTQSNLATANNILITITGSSTFQVTSENPDCGENNSGTYEITSDEIILRIGSSCRGPVSLFDDNDDNDVLRDIEISSDCDAFSGTDFGENGLPKGFLDCSLNGNGNNSPSSSSSSDSSSDSSSSSSSSSSNSSTSDDDDSSSSPSSSGILLITNLILSLSFLFMLI